MINSLRDRGRWCDDAKMDGPDAAQAVELIRALREQLHRMTHQLASLERHDFADTNSRAPAVRREAAALRLDISEAQLHIDRLQRRYLHTDEHARPRRPMRHPGLNQPAGPRASRI
jgi:hypothetical protein